MGLEATCQGLCLSLQQLRDALKELHMGVVEDHPTRGETVLVDLIGNTAEDLLGWLEGSMIAAEDAFQAARRTGGLDRAGRALATCHERFQEIERRYSFDLASFDRIHALRDLGRKRQGEWRAWSSSIQESIGRCRQPLHEVSTCLVRCWRELSERLGPAASPTLTPSPLQDVRTNGVCEHRHESPN